MLTLEINRRLQCKQQHHEENFASVTEFINEQFAKIDQLEANRKKQELNWRKSTRLLNDLPSDDPTFEKMKEHHTFRSHVLLRLAEKSTHDILKLCIDSNDRLAQAIEDAEDIFKEPPLEVLVEARQRLKATEEDRNVEIKRLEQKLEMWKGQEKEYTEEALQLEKELRGAMILNGLPADDNVLYTQALQAREQEQQKRRWQQQQQQEEPSAEESATTWDKFKGAVVGLVTGKQDEAGASAESPVQHRS